DVVLADGRCVRASTDANEDLFWAVRGGGGNFGVVTEFTFRAHPVSDVVGGPTFWAIEQTDEILSAYREFLPKLPRNATGFFCWHTVPPAPPFPEEIHMRKVCGIVWCIVGSDEDAERAMSPMLEIAEPLILGVDSDPASAGALREWAVRYWEAVHPYSAGGAYVNFMMDDEGQERVKATYGVNYGRLARAKATYDPENAFRVNQNIQPDS